MEKEDKNNNLLESEGLLEDEKETLIKEKLKVLPKTNSLFKIYCHFFGCIDWFFFILALIGSLGAGATIPTLMYISSDVLIWKIQQDQKMQLKISLPLFRK